MSRASRGREPRPRPVERIELTEGNTTTRLIAVGILIALAAGFFAYGISQLVSRKSGWTQIEPKNAEELSCASEFILQYDLGRSGSSATVEYKQLSALYGEAAAAAYRTYHPTQLFDGHQNLAYLNQHPNEAVTVDETLYRALQKVVESGSRLIYLAPVYELYDAMFGCQYDYEAENFDPARNSGVKVYVQEVLAYAGDENAISLELMENGQVRLNVSQEYLSFAEENEVSALLDFFWMKNAFIADDLADALESAGYRNGLLTSYDGYSRMLGGEEDYSFNLSDNVDGVIYPAAVVRCGGARAVVYFRAYAAGSQDSLRTYTYEDGTVRTAYIDPASGFCRAAVNDLAAYSAEKSCAEIALALGELYLSRKLDVPAILSLREDGVESLFCKDRVIWHSQPDVQLDELFSGADVQYSERAMSEYR